MHFLEQGAQALRAEAELLSAALRDRRLVMSLGLFAILLLLAIQVPPRYTIAIGKEEGYGSDRPIVAGFHDPETSESLHTDFRWTTEQSFIRLPGMGQRPLQLRLRLLPVNQEVALRGPKEIEVWANNRLLGRLPIRPTTGGVYSLLVPPPADGSGNQEIELRGSTFKPTGDQRAIGTPVDWAVVEGRGGPVLPAWGSTLAWLVAAALLWLALRRAGLAPNIALAALLAGILLASLAALLDPPRFAFGATAALIALALGWLLMLLLNAAPAGLLLAGAALALPAAVVWVAGALVGGIAGGHGGTALQGIVAALLLAGWLGPAFGALYRRVAPPIPADTCRWLMLLALVVLTTRYGGKIYPDAMWGDIGFHTNRYTEVLQGRVLLLSRNRGVDFPYPPAFYLLLAPFSLLGVDKRALLQLGGALLDAASPFLIYTIAVCGIGWASGGRPAASTRLSGLLAAGIYSLSASGYMTTWWNFSTHIFSQFAHLLLITAILDFRFWILDLHPVDTNPKSKIQNPKLSWLAVVATLFVLQSLVYLGHFGFWMNMSLLGGMGLAALLMSATRNRGPWAPFWSLVAVFVAAQLLAALLYYSAYTGLFIAQAQATASGGLTGLANRGPTDRALLWKNLWDAGFRVHFGFFPVPLALCGLALLWRRPTTDDRRTTNDERRTTDLETSRQGDKETRRQRQRSPLLPFSPSRLLPRGRWPVVILMAGTFVIALFFGVLPFITGSTLSTRWLMFSAWAIAVGAAVTIQLLWRAGRAGRWLVIAIGGYIIWIAASMWLGALAWRIRPPEPF